MRNWGCDQEIFFTLLESIAARHTGIQIVCTMCAEHIVRDADRIELYRRAGIVCVGMGVESLDETVLKRLGKNNGFEITSQAVHLLRDNSILSIVNIIYGLQDETWSSVWKTLRQLQRISPDFYNALHMTPLSWTYEGRRLDPVRIVQLGQRKWDFRQPVIQPTYFSPRMLAMAVIAILENNFRLAMRFISRSGRRSGLGWAWLVLRTCPMGRIARWRNCTLRLGLFPRSEVMFG